LGCRHVRRRGVGGQQGKAMEATDQHRDQAGGKRLCVCVCSQGPRPVGQGSNCHTCMHTSPKALGKCQGHELPLRSNTWWFAGFYQIWQEAAHSCSRPW
jgi:hypothetical protein